MIETKKGKKIYSEFEQGYQQGKADAIEEYVKSFCDKDNQSNFVELNRHSYSWNAYARHIAEQLKEQK